MFYTPALITGGNILIVFASKTKSTLNCVVNRHKELTSFLGYKFIVRTRVKSK